MQSHHQISSSLCIRKRQESLTAIDDVPLLAVNNTSFKNPNKEMSLRAKKTRSSERKGEVNVQIKKPKKAKSCSSYELLAHRRRPLIIYRRRLRTSADGDQNERNTITSCQNSEHKKEQYELRPVNYIGDAVQYSEQHVNISSDGVTVPLACSEDFAITPSSSGTETDDILVDTERYHTKNKLAAETVVAINKSLIYKNHDEALKNLFKQKIAEDSETIPCESPSSDESFSNIDLNEVRYLVNDVIIPEALEHLVKANYLKCDETDSWTEIPLNDEINTLQDSDFSGEISSYNDTNLEDITQSLDVSSVLFDDSPLKFSAETNNHLCHEKSVDGVDVVDAIDRGNENFGAGDVDDGDCVELVVKTTTEENKTEKKKEKLQDTRKSKKKALEMSQSRSTWLTMEYGNDCILPLSPLRDDFTNLPTFTFAEKLTEISPDVFIRKPTKNDQPLLKRPTSFPPVKFKENVSVNDKEKEKKETKFLPDLDDVTLRVFCEPPYVSCQYGGITTMPREDDPDERSRHRQMLFQICAREKARLERRNEDESSDSKFNYFAMATLHELARRTLDRTNINEEFHIEKKTCVNRDDTKNIHWSKKLCFGTIHRGHKYLEKVKLVDLIYKEIVLPDVVPEPELICKPDTSICSDIIDFASDLTVRTAPLPQPRVKKLEDWEFVPEADDIDLSYKIEEEQRDQNNSSLSFPVVLSTEDRADWCSFKPSFEEFKALLELHLLKGREKSATEECIFTDYKCRETDIDDVSEESKFSSLGGACDNSNCMSTTAHPPADYNSLIVNFCQLNADKSNNASPFYDSSINTDQVDITVDLLSSSRENKNAVNVTVDTRGDATLKGSLNSFMFDGTIEGKESLKIGRSDKGKTKKKHRKSLLGCASLCSCWGKQRLISDNMTSDKTHSQQSLNRNQAISNSNTNSTQECNNMNEMRPSVSSGSGRSSKFSHIEKRHQLPRLFSKRKCYSASDATNKAVLKMQSSSTLCDERQGISQLMIELSSLGKNKQLIESERRSSDVVGKRVSSNDAGTVGQKTKR